jgi:hypothetical protein
LGVFSFGGGSTAAQTVDKDCRDFVSQRDAQQYFDSHGGSATNDVDGLDGNDHDGIVCETFDYEGGGSIATSAPTIVPTDIVIVPTDVATAPTTAPGEPTTVPAVTPTTDPGATPVTTNPGGGSSNSGGNASGGSSSAGGTSAVTSLPNTGAGSSSTETGLVWLALALAGVLGAGALAYRRSRA